MTKTLKVGPKLQLPLDAVTRTTAIVGQRGTGKTSTAVVLTEEALTAGAQAAVIDPTGAWYGLRSSADGKHAGLEVVVFGGHHGDVPLDPGAGAFLARLIIDEAISVVLDLELMTKGKQVHFVAELAEELYHRNRRALTLVVDEAHRFAPQQLRDPGGYGARCLGAVTDVVTLGRRKGLGAVLISQRPAKINKDVFEQAEIVVAHRLMGPNDRKAIAGWLDEAASGDTPASPADLPGLERGQALVWAPSYEIYGRYTIRPKRTFDSSATPEIGETVIEPKGRADIDLAAIETAMADTIEKAKADNPTELRKTIAGLRREKAALEHQVAELEQRPAEIPAPEEVEVPILSDTDRADMRRLQDTLGTLVDRFPEGRLATVELPSPPSGPRPRPAPPTAARAAVTATAPTGRPRPVPAAGPEGSSNDSVSVPQQKLLDAIAWFEAIGVQHPKRTVVAAVAGVSSKSSGFRANVSTLSGKQLVAYPASGYLALTPDGRATANPPDIAPTQEALQDAICRMISRPQADLLRVLIDHYPHALHRDELAQAAGVSAASSGFRANVSTLSGFELVTYPAQGTVAAADLLFPNAR